MNVKRGDTHTDMKPWMDGKKTWTVTSTVETSSPSVSLEGTKGYWQMVQLPNGGGEKSFAEISMLSKEEKEKVINGMTDDDFKKYEKWEEEKENLMAMKKSEWKKAELIEIDKANEWKKAELIRTYYAYVTNIEAWAGGERAVLNKILEKDFTPQDLKQRVENLLRRKDMKLALR